MTVRVCVCALELSSIILFSNNFGKCLPTYGHICFTLVDACCMKQKRQEKHNENNKQKTTAKPN